MFVTDTTEQLSAVSGIGKTPTQAHAVFVFKSISGNEASTKVGGVLSEVVTLAIA